MKPIRTSHTNLELGAPPDWNATRDGECESLPCLHNGMIFASWWFPSAVELAMLNTGGAVKLTMLSSAHPPVQLEAVEPSSFEIIRRTP